VTFMGPPFGYWCDLREIPAESFDGDNRNDG
jgi:hypothetical protein